MNGARRTWVVFTDQTDFFVLRWLRRGFRHCWILTHDGTHWISLDPLADRMELIGHYHLEKSFDLPLWLHTQGHTVLSVPERREPPPRTLPLRWLSCVEITKHFLGIRAFWVITPYSLYRYIQKGK